MSHASRLWSWFPSSEKWVVASVIGAYGRFTTDGCEAAYGRHAPCRKGIHAENFPPLYRDAAWHAFMAEVNRSPCQRHRIRPA